MTTRRLDLGTDIRRSVSVHDVAQFEFRRPGGVGGGGACALTRVEQKC